MKKRIRRFLVIGILVVSCLGYLLQITPLVYASNEFQGVTINVLLTTGPAYKMFYDAGIPMFEQETGIKVKRTEIGGMRAYDKSALLAAAKSSVFDVYSTHFAVIASHTNDFEPLESYLSVADYADFVPAGIEPLTFDGHILALPRRFDVRLLYYRTDLFKKAGVVPPKTWEDLVTVGQKLTHAPAQYGFVTVGKGDPALREFSDLLWQAGGDFLDEDYNPIFNSSAGVKALQFWRDLIYKYKIVPREVPTFEWAEQSQLFKSGVVAMVIDWPYCLGLYSAEDSSVKGKYSWARLPRDETSISTAVCHGYAINKYSKKKGAAWEFVKWMTSKGLMIESQTNGSIPTRKSVMERVISEATGEERVRWNLLSEEVANGKAWPKLIEWGEIAPIIWDELEAALIGIKPIERALNDAAKGVKSVLEKAGYYSRS